METTEDNLSKELKTGDEVEIHLDKNELKIVKTGKIHKLKDIGDVKEVVEAGGIFKYARKKGMIK